MTELSTLKMIDFSDLQNWSILSYVTKTSHHFKYKLVQIGDCIKRIKDDVVVQDDIEYKRATIKINNGGIFLRDKVKGSKIGTKKQFVIHKGQLLLSKIDARNGAFGIVPEELDDGIITGNFWVYEIDETQILPQILCGILASNYFQTIWETCSNGTTNRHYLQETSFLNTLIPVPTIEEQKDIVDNYNKHLAEANNLQNKYSYWTIENKIADFLQLQVENIVNTNDLLSFADYSTLETWDVRYRQKEVLKSLKYKCQPLSKLAFINPPLKKKINEEQSVSFVPMECVSDIDGEIREYRICKASEKGFTKFENGDIIWAKITPCMQNGKSALVSNLVNGVGYGSTEFYVIRIYSTEVLPEYIYFLLRMHRVRQAAVGYFSGTAGQQRVQKSYLENLSIPMPSLEEQKNLIKDLNEIKTKIIETRKQSEMLTLNAKQDFEDAIFKE